MTNAAKDCLTTLNTYWDEEIITKPTMRIHIAEKTQGPTPQTTILNIVTAQAGVNEPSINQNGRVKDYPVQIQFFCVEYSTTDNNDNYIKAIDKALRSDYTGGCGYWWVLNNVMSTPFDKGMDSSGNQIIVYDNLILATKKQWISDWS